MRCTSFLLLVLFSSLFPPFFSILFLIGHSDHSFSLFIFHFSFCLSFLFFVGFFHRFFHFAWTILLLVLTISFISSLCCVRCVLFLQPSFFLFPLLICIIVFSLLPSILPFCLDNLVARSDHSQFTRDVKRDISELLKQFHSSKHHPRPSSESSSSTPSSSSSSRPSRSSCSYSYVSFREELKSLRKELHERERNAVMDVLAKAQVCFSFTFHSFLFVLSFHSLRFFFSFHFILFPFHSLFFSFLLVCFCSILFYYIQFSSLSAYAFSLILFCLLSLSVSLFVNVCDVGHLLYVDWRR